MKIFLLFYMCHFAVGLTHCYKTTVFTGRPARSAAMPVLFVLTGPKMGFSPTGATRCSDKRESWHGGADRNCQNICCIPY